MEEQKSNTNKYLVIAVIVLIVAICLIIFFNSNSTDELEMKNKTLTESAKQDLVLIEAYREQHNIDAKSIDSLIIRLDDEQSEDEQINKKQDEKISTINLYTTSQQQAYFDSIATDYLRKKARGSYTR